MIMEEMVIGGETIQLEHANLPMDQVHLDEGNPRIRYRLKYVQDGKSLDEAIMGMPEVPRLSKDIELNRGLRERVIVQKNGTGYKVLEGNCRTVCYRNLAKKHPDDDAWKTIPARILPKDTDPKQVAILISDMHVAGKITWKAHEKAGQVYRMRSELGMSFDEIATYLRQSKTTAIRFYDAYSFMAEKFLSVDEGKYAKEGEGKWSFFDELYRSKDLREELKHNPDFGEQFCRWVGEKHLPDGADVRKLPAILKNLEAREKFEEGVPLPEVEKMLEDAEPEHGSDFFKQLAKMRDNFSSAAQVKEILRIRHDKKARQRVLDTYEAMVDFMRLADIEPPKP